MTHAGEQTHIHYLLSSIAETAGGVGRTPGGVDGGLDILGKEGEGVDKLDNGGGDVVAGGSVCVLLREEK